MPWLPLTANDVLAVLNNSELTAYQQFRLANNQADPLATLIGHVTGEIRAAIRLRHTLDAGGGLPSSLLGGGAAVVAYRLLLRCNAKPSDARAAAHDDAIRLLERVSRGEVGIEAPTNPSPEQTSAPAPQIKPRRLHFTPRDQEGI
jgi:hypothetical protein